MGWLHTYGAGKSSVIKERCEREENENVIYETLRHCCKGNVLWRIVQVTRKQTGEVIKYIACDLLRGGKDGWGYKDMDESVGPYYYSCPITYLDDVPVVACEEWREKVREYHRLQSRKFIIGKKYALVGCAIPHIVITSVKPLRGVYCGIVYRGKKSLIGDEIVDTPT